MSIREIDTKSPLDGDGLKIQEGFIVLIRLPNGERKSVVLERDSCVSLGKFGVFNANELFGHPFGWTYEISGKSLKIIPPRDIHDIEDTDATNELINDGDLVQPLTVIDIEALKEAGAHASDIIQKQIEQHANYSLKTEYSKDKYKMRKEAKYFKTFMTIEPTLYNVCDFWYKKDQNRIRDIRPDTLSQMLSMADIRPGGRYIVVDDASGLVVSAVLERMGCQGRLVTICDVESPPAYPIVPYMNFSQSAVESAMSSLNWATADETHFPIVLSSDPSLGEYKSDRQKARLSKRKAVNDRLLATRDELFTGNFDGLLIASELEPFSIISLLSAYLAASSSIVVQSPYLMTLVDLQTKLRALPGYLGPSISEAWLRQYQVLPGRTHPMMNATGTGGYLLHAIKVHDDPNASSVLAHRSKRK